MDFYIDFYGSYFLTIRKARFLVTSPDSPRALVPKITCEICFGLRTGENCDDVLLMFGKRSIVI